MKAVLFDREAEKPLLLPPEVTIIADSAITPPGRPVFLPDFDSEWVAEFYLTARVSRLGKDISPKFAPRYIDSMTVAMRLVPVTLSAGFRMAVRPSGTVSIFDNALTLGKWINPSDCSSPIIVSINDINVTLDDAYSAATEAVSVISRYCTLKTGDLVMPFRVLPGLAVKTGTLFTVSLASTTILDVKLH